MMTGIDIEFHFNCEIGNLARLIDKAPFENREYFYKWMCQQYYLVQNSTRYLTLSASKVPVGDSASFRDWVHHVKEETDHDQTLLKDIRALGFDSLIPMYPETRALIASQYYDIQQNGPEALLGYALMLEGLSCERGATVAERVKRAHGINSTYLKLHAHVDQEHFPEGMNRIKTYSEERKRIILDNLLMMSSLYQAVLQRTAADNANKAQASPAA